MSEKRWLYFALGVTTVISIGAVGNQLVPLAPATGLELSDTGITFPDGTVQTTAAPSDPRRAFYLTSSTHNGAQALTACEPGFHMASMWEILDPSNLRYATDAEGGNDVLRRGDSGVGPPSKISGWVRTGYFSEGGLPLEGFSNCSAWTSASSEESGTTVYLLNIWDSLGGCDGTPSLFIAPWDSITSNCISVYSVWCAEDSALGG